MSTDRPALRARLRQARRDLPPTTRIRDAENLARQLLALPFAPVEGPVAGYWAMDGEIALHVWQLQLPKAVTYCLPVLAGDYLMFAPWQPGQPLATNRYGIPEPDVDGDALLPAEAMQLVVMPLVGFDAQGNRLGMGGGWYDRSFEFRQRRAPPPWLVGAAFDAQRVDALATQAWDVRPDAICTGSTTLLASTTHDTSTA